MMKDFDVRMGAGDKSNRSFSAKDGSSTNTNRESASAYDAGVFCIIRAPFGRLCDELALRLPLPVRPSYHFLVPTIMQTLIRTLLVFAFVLSAQAADPLRIFIRGGQSNRGEEVHAHPRFLKEWTALLTERGAKVDGATDWPTADQLAKTDVVIVYAQDGGNATEDQKKNLGDYIKRGGGMVVIHTGAVGNDPAWWKSVIGGAWVQGKTKWKEGPMDLYYTENQYIGGGHPITKGAANFHLDDEIYYDMDISPAAKILATSYTPNVPSGKKVAEGGKAHIYDIQPQMWAYERTAEGAQTPYRAFVSIPGHQFKSFSLPQYRSILMRGIAWAGKRDNLDELCKAEELDQLAYPPGGPQRPADTLKALEIHPDFNISLVAAEPLINKPMNFDWDPSGRLWVAETPEYPNGRRGMRPDYRGKEWKDHGGIDPEPGDQTRPGHDKISILTDSNGDGAMDKKEIFYEGLDLVTGLVFYKDGVIVTQAPDILWLRDTNGDGKADKVEKLYTGLGTGDTHAVINNPRWGWDGWIYATHGYSGSSNVRNAKGEKMAGINSGVVRFKPDGSIIEQYSSKGGNTWGLEITGDNRVMWTQPTSGQLLMQTVLPEYALSRGSIGKTASFNVIEPSPKSYPAMSWEQLAYVQIDWVGSFTAAAGCVIYDGGSWPKEYNGDYLTTEPTINVVHHTRLTPKASSYTAKKLPGREETEFIRSKDMWWRPIEVRVGPDGAVYVGDFYNQAVIHNDTRGPDHNRVNAAVRPDRDHYYGRIWRLNHKTASGASVPKLSIDDPAGLIAALDHPNRPVRMTASRLLVEAVAGGRGVAAITTGVKGKLTSPSAETRIAALWTAQGAGILAAANIDTALKDSDAAVRRNAAAVIEASGNAKSVAAVGPLVNDEDGQVRLAALRAMAATALSDADAKGIVTSWKKFDDDFQRSAAVGALAQNGAAAIAAVLDSGDPALVGLVGQLTLSVAEKGDASAAGKLVAALADKPASADALKGTILDTLSKSLKTTPSMTPDLKSAFAKLLGSSASRSALPLAAKWDKEGSLKDVIAQKTKSLLGQLNGNSTPDGEKLAAARSLIGLRSANAEALPAVLKAVTGKISSGLQRDLIQALGESGDAAVGSALVGSFAQLAPDVQPVAFEIMLKRADSAEALLDAAKSKKIDLVTLGPANLARLRTHPDKSVAQQANAVLDDILGPAMKAKNEAIAKLSAEIEKPGDPAKGKELFTQTCAICHKFGDSGAEIGPVLTGMGAHGPGELLTAIVDPNREVDPSFVSWNIETKDGSFHTGVIARENPTSVVLRSLAGQEEIKTAEIKSRVNTGRSLMPEGFEGLGGQVLRDILAYMISADGGKFRTFDLREAFTATTARGLYADGNDAAQSIRDLKGGNLTFDGVPFNVVAPDKAANGKNVIQLRGGPSDSFAKTMPTRVEVKGGGFKANRLHFLGGVGGWGYPFDSNKMVVLKATVQFAGGTSEVLEFRNGVEFADYIRREDVPGSKFAPDVSRGTQVRWFSRQLKEAAPIEKIVLESTDTGVAPTTLAITAELADANAAPVKSADAVPKTDNFVPQFSDALPQPPASAKGPRVLLVGGGSSHDFVKFFGASDKATLADSVGWVEFTQNANGVPSIMKDLDVLVWSANQPIASQTAKALMDWVNAGKPLVLLHPGTWYVWNNFPEWNSIIAGGGTRGHDALGEYEVNITPVTHPVTAGVTKTFKITDELYNYAPDPKGTAIEVLATATSPKSGKTFPQVFIVKHPKARIVGITLGHDARAHDLPEFKQLLKQSVLWAAGK